MDVWQKIKKEYIAGGTSYRKLASKYGVSFVTLGKKAKAEGWTTLRQQADDKRTTRAVEAVADSGAQIDDAVFQAALKLLMAFNASVDAVAGEPMSPTALKDYGSALKSIQACIDKPSKLDIEEQRARIDKLRKDTAPDTAKEVEIRIKGWDDAWAN